MNSRENSNLFRDFSELSRRILHYSNQGLSRSAFLQEVSKILLDYSRCTKLVLVVSDGDFYYSWEACRDCGDTFSFRTIDVEEFRRYLQGSLISGEGTPGVDGSVESDPDYPSVLRVPLIIDEANSGVLYLKSCVKGRFQSEEFEFYRGIAQALGMSAANRRAQVALRERVKELTCLYGIAQIVQSPELTPEEIFGKLVDLIPPAMQYPESASCKLVLDDSVFVTGNIDDRGEKLSSDIIINGEKRGVVEVFYSCENPIMEQSLFLKEEEILLEGVSRQASLIMEMWQAELEKTRIHHQLQHADRLATIGQLAAGTAHELNEPLAGILGFAQLAQKTPDLPDQVGEDLDRIISASLHAREIIRNLLIFARQMPTKKMRTNLNLVIEEALTFIHSRLQKERVDISLSLDPGIPSIILDPAQINQVLVNLIVNAVQAMPGGGTLSLRSGYDTSHVTFEVEDTGIGMSEATMRQIFVPFFTTKDVGHGTGLGLSVVHGIVSSHNGTITVESAPDRGTVFRVRFPV